MRGAAETDTAGRCRTIPGGSGNGRPGQYPGGYPRRSWGGVTRGVLLLLLLQAIGVDAADVFRRPSADPGHGRQTTLLPRLAEPAVRQEVSQAMAEKRRQAKQDAWDLAVRQGRQPWGLFGNVYYELTAVKGGRDADSITCNTAAWLGALAGNEIWPKKWWDTVQQANIHRMNLEQTAQDLIAKGLENRTVALSGI